MARSQIGRKLRRYAIEAGVSHPRTTVVQPLRLEGEAKTLPWLSLDATSDALLASGLASRAEIDAALNDLSRFTADPRTLVSGPRMFQVWARRESAR